MIKLKILLTTRGFCAIIKLDKGKSIPMANGRVETAKVQLTL
jgi:hypothetical protein